MHLIIYLTHKFSVSWFCKLLNYTSYLLNNSFVYSRLDKMFVELEYWKRKKLEFSICLISEV